MQDKARQLALRASLIYGLVAGAWILLSDRLVAVLIPEAEHITNLQTYKGWAFVGITAALLYAVLSRLMREQERVAAERRRAEEKVRQLSHAVEQSPVSVVITDTTGKIEYVNPKFTEVTGYTFEEAVGQNPRILKSGEFPPEKYRKLWQRISAGGTWFGEFHNRKKNGDLFWEWAAISPILDAAGKATHFVAIKEDITERKRVEEALRASEERFRLLTENASDIVSVINGVGVIRFQSPSVERVLGYRPEEMLGRSVLEFIHPEEAPQATAAIQRMMAEPGTPTLLELRLRHRDGTWRVLQSIGKSIPNRASDGFIVVNSRDVTENRRLEEQFRQSQKMEAIGQLAGGVAHDFNNILTVIQMQAGLLEAGGGLAPTQRDFAREITKAAQRAANLTRQLLLFSRRQAMQPRDLDLNEVITNIAKMLQRILGEDVRMQFKFAPRPLFIRADAGMMDQVLMNLAVNSRDAMPKGGQLIVETSAVELDGAVAPQFPQARPGSFACLSVTDTGCGIPPEVLPRIFEPFFTTKDVGKGTGLGLATVFGIVQQHQGWINVYSEIGQGTTFRIHLPCLARGDGSEAAPLALASLRGGNETILLAEDEPSLRTLLQETLTQLGYRVLEAPTGVLALQVWKQKRDEIHLLLTDLVMPDGMNGKELAHRLLLENPRLKVIYTSGYSAEVAGQDFPLQDGVNFLAKPFHVHKLARTIRDRLDQP